MRPSVLALAALPLAMARGCNSPTATVEPSAATPTPTPTPAPTAPAFSTLFENLPLVRSLEAATGRSTVLVALSGFSDLKGRVKKGDSWAYDFSDPTNPDVRLYEWRVTSEGSIRQHPPVAPAVRDLHLVELGPHLTIDSTEAVRLALSYGAQRFVDSFPSAYVAMGLRFRAGVATWQLQFDVLPGGPGCSLGPIYINASTGALLDRELDCLSRF